MDKKRVWHVVASSILSLCEVLALNVVYYVPSDSDAYSAISNMLSSFYISGLDPWIREMNLPMKYIGKLCNNFQNFSFLIPILFVLLLITNYKFIKQNAKKPAGFYILAALFGIVQTMGISVHRTESLDFCFAGTYQFMLFIICSIGYFGLYMLVFWAVLTLFKNSRDKLIQNGNGALEKTETKELWISFGIICLIYCIWLAVFYPGSVDWDSHWAVSQFLEGNANQHFPMLTTWLHVGTLLLGRALGSDNIGVFIYVFIQTIFMGYAFCKVLRLEMMMGMTKLVRGLSLAFYALVPVWGIYAQSEIKNTLFTVSFTIFIADFIEVLLRLNEGTDKKLLIRFGISSFFTCLLLSQGMYVVLITLFVCALCEFIKTKRKDCVIVFAAVLALVIGFNSFVSYGLKIPGEDPDCPGELYSLPSIATSYYISANRDNLTPEEIEIIEKVYTCDVDTLAAGYLRGMADGTKSYWNPDSTTSEKITYFASWIKSAFKHPQIYLEAVLGQSYGYYVLAPTDNITNFEKESYYDYWMKYSDHDYDIMYGMMSYQIRDMFSAWTHFFERNPITGWITNQGLATWIILTLAVMILCRRKKEKKELYVILALLLYILSCIASPVNGLLRYYLPIFGVIPLVWAMIIREDVNDYSEK